MTFIDSNIPMYLIGAAHPHKTEAQLILERLMTVYRILMTDSRQRLGGHLPKLTADTPIMRFEAEPGGALLALFPAALPGGKADTDCGSAK